MQIIRHYGNRYGAPSKTIKYNCCLTQPSHHRVYIQRKCFHFRVTGMPMSTVALLLTARNGYNLTMGKKGGSTQNGTRVSYMKDEILSCATTEGPWRTQVRESQRGMRGTTSSTLDHQAKKPPCESFLLHSGKPEVYSLKEKTERIPAYLWAGESAPEMEGVNEDSHT